MRCGWTWCRRWCWTKPIACWTWASPPNANGCWPPCRRGARTCCSRRPFRRTYRPWRTCCCTTRCGSRPPRRPRPFRTSSSARSRSMPRAARNCCATWCSRAAGDACWCSWPRAMPRNTSRASWPAAACTRRRCTETWASRSARACCRTCAKVLWTCSSPPTWRPAASTCPDSPWWSTTTCRVPPTTTCTASAARGARGRAASR